MLVNKKMIKGMCTCSAGDCMIADLIHWVAPNRWSEKTNRRGKIFEEAPDFLLSSYLDPALLTTSGMFTFLIFLEVFLLYVFSLPMKERRKVEKRGHSFRGSDSLMATQH